MGYTETPNYKLKKPDINNNFALADLNNNLDLIDGAVKKVETKVDNIRVDVVQNANGITIGGNVLQDASTSKDGLMTKEQVSALNAKANASSLSNYVPTSRTINGHKLTGNISITSSDVGALPVSGTAHAATRDGSGNVITTQYATKQELSDRTSGIATSGAVKEAQQKADSAYALAVTAQSKANSAHTKADSAYTLASGKADASALNSYVPNSRTINGKKLTTNITLSPLDIGAQPSGNYATTDQIPDISGLATKQELEDKTSGIATSGAVKAAQEKANSAYNLANSAQSKANSAQSKADSAYTLASGKADASALNNYVPTVRKVNGKPLSNDISLAPSDVGAQPKGDYATRTEVTQELAEKQPIGNYITAEQIPDVSALATKGYVDTKLSSVYKFMGSCSTAQLASKEKTVGNVWNLTDAGEYGPIGTNVAWTGAEWDALAGITDLSGITSRLDTLAENIQAVDSDAKNYTDKNVATLNSTIEALKTATNASIKSLEDGQTKLTDNVNSIAPIVTIDNEALPKTITVKVNGKSSTAAFDAQGEIIFSEPLPYAICKVVKNSTGKTVYEGEVSTDPILTGPGNFTITITQFGEVYTQTLDIDDKIQISVPSFTKIVNRSPNATLFKIEGTVINESSLRMISDKSYAVYEEFGKISTHPLVGYGSVTTNSDNVTPHISYSEPIKLTTSGTYTFPTTCDFEILLCGGGGGGGGGGSRSGDSGATGGEGGNGGAVTTLIYSATKGTTFNAVVGAGGVGGANGPIDESDGSNGATGSATYFNDNVALGGKGGAGGSWQMGKGGDGGDGWNGKTTTIFGKSYSYGRGGYGDTTDGYKGSTSDKPYGWYSGETRTDGKGGNSGVGKDRTPGRTGNGTGGEGGFGIDFYGHGGKGQYGRAYGSSYKAEDGTAGVIIMRGVNL